MSADDLLTTAERSLVNQLREAHAEVRRLRAERDALRSVAHAIRNATGGTGQ